MPSALIARSQGSSPGPSRFRRRTSTGSMPSWPRPRRAVAPAGSALKTARRPVGAARGLAGQHHLRLAAKAGIRYGPGSMARVSSGTIGRAFVNTPRCRADLGAQPEQPPAGVECGRQPVRCSREWLTATRCSARSSTHLTGRPSVGPARAPGSPRDRTRRERRTRRQRPAVHLDSVSSMPSSPAIRSRLNTGTLVVPKMSSRPVTGSGSASRVRGSSGTAPCRPIDLHLDHVVGRRTRRPRRRSRG